MLRSITTRAAGLAIVILALWGGLIPFVGPYFHFTLGPDQTWTWTAGRLYLSVLPSVGALVGGLWLIGAGPWASRRVGAVLAVLSGVWFAVGPELSTLWHQGGQVGVANGTTVVQAMERLGLHSGLGVVIAVLAAFALASAVELSRRVPTAVAPGVGATVATPAPAGEPSPVGGTPVAERERTKEPVGV